MRRQIAHALQARSKAIRNALIRFNAAARAAGREELDWSEIIQYSFLAQFDVLRGSQDVRTKPWATPQGRQAIDLYYKMARSHEQLVRSQNEATNLLTFMQDDERYLQQAFLKLRESNSPLAFQVRRRYRFQVRMNDEHRKRLAALPQLDGVSISETAAPRPGFNLSDIPSLENHAATASMVQEMQDEASEVGVWGSKLSQESDDIYWEEEEEEEEAVDAAVVIAGVAVDS